MPIEERLRMYREKKNFIFGLAKAFSQYPKSHSVQDITYEVWHKYHKQFGHQFTEWVIVHYDGGAKSYLRVTGNSNTANFRAIGEVLDHGYYEDKVWYKERQVELGYKKLDLTKMCELKEED